MRIVVVLPAPFGPRNDLAFTNLEIQVLNRGLACVTFGEIFDFYHLT
jgi:hypothetical protein